jgi:hypothetical protein
VGPAAAGELGGALVKGHPRTDELLAPLWRALGEAKLPTLTQTTLYNRAWQVAFSLCAVVEEAKRGEVAGAVLAERLNQDLAEVRGELEASQSANRSLIAGISRLTRERDQALRELAAERGIAVLAQGQVDAQVARMVVIARERDAARHNLEQAGADRDAEARQVSGLTARVRELEEKLSAREAVDRILLEAKEAGLLRSEHALEAIAAEAAAARKAG